MIPGSVPWQKHSLCSSASPILCVMAFIIPQQQASGSGLMFWRDSYYLLITEEFLVEEGLLALQFMSLFSGPCLRVTQGKRMENHMHPVSGCSSVPHISAEPGKVQHPPVLQCCRKFQGPSQFSFSRRNRVLPGEKKMQV